jgi:Recombinase
MARRRLRRKNAKSQRHADPLVENRMSQPAPVPRAVAPPAVRAARRVERLTYTRTQAAEALGVSPATFSRRVLPLIETIELPWGTRLIPVDELERVLDERRQQPAAERQPILRPGRKAAVRAEIVARIRDERLSGRTYREIARRLNADRVQTAQAGREWWPSTVRAVFVRSCRPRSVP